MQSIAASNKIAPANASVRPTSAKAARRAASIVPNATQEDIMKLATQREPLAA